VFHVCLLVVCVCNFFYNISVHLSLCVACVRVFFYWGRLLVGAPCEAIDLSSNLLNLELVWQRLVEFRRCKLPMGCATDGDHKALREVGRGLFIYDCVRSFESRGGERGVKDGHFF
jgi:hypothetical protein